MEDDPTSAANEALRALVVAGTEDRLASYRPYPYQKRWHNIRGKGTDQPANQKALIAANQIGKTVCGSAEDAMHATGEYPDWWEGRRFDHPVNLQIAGVTADKVRDTLQEKLFGDPHDWEMLGTGLIPKRCIVGNPIYKQGYRDCIDNAAVYHKSGGISRVRFLSYEAGWRKFMATSLHVVHYDEEPPQEIYSQGLRAVIATRGLINLTFTAEEGYTQITDSFLNDLQFGQAVLMATWEDAPHIADYPEWRAQLLAAIPEHQRALRSQGIPMVGAGLVFSISDEAITCPHIEIPPYWPRIIGVDFGGADHPFAAASMAFDREADKVYIYDEYKETGPLPVHADALKRRGGGWIPIAWPHDVGKKDPRSGQPLADILRDEYELNMLPFHFTNPPAPGKDEGSGGYGIEVGLWAMLTSMQEGRFKVFESLGQWLREKNLYHRKDGKVNPRFDDLMSATRYGYMMRRFADVRPRPRAVSGMNRPPRGMKNW